MISGWRHAGIGFCLTLSLLACGIASCGVASHGAAAAHCEQEADCERGFVCDAGACAIPTIDRFDYTEEMDAQARAFLNQLKARQLNVVTAESLTAGMIVATLVDVPADGAYVYGGFATYDSDAKRQDLGVRVGDVYTKECSLEMAIGAALHSRALVGVAVTGNAGPVARDDLDSLGVVDVAVAIRTDVAAPGSDLPADPAFPQTFTSVSRRINACDADGHPETRELCEKYKIEAAEDPDGYVSNAVLTVTRKLIRQDTVIDALALGNAHLDAYHCEAVGQAVVCPDLSALCIADYDGQYTAYGEPSWVIEQHMGSTPCPIRP